MNLGLKLSVIGGNKYSSDVRWILNPSYPGLVDTYLWFDKNPPGEWKDSYFWND